MSWKHENVYIYISAWSPRYYPPEFFTFANTTGRKRVMSGTNFPQLTWKACVDGVKYIGGGLGRETVARECGSVYVWRGAPSWRKIWRRRSSNGGLLAAFSARAASRQVGDVGGVKWGRRGMNDRGRGGSLEGLDRPAKGPRTKPPLHRKSIMGWSTLLLG